MRASGSGTEEGDLRLCGVDGGGGEWGVTYIPITDRAVTKLSTLGCSRNASQKRRLVQDSVSDKFGGCTL